MNEYILIFRHPNAEGAATEEQIKSWMAMTNEWLNSIAAEGKLVSRGKGFSFEDACVVGFDKQVKKGAFGNAGDSMGGYVIVSAESAEEAAEMAKGSPVLMGDGNTIEVRRIV